LDKSPYFSLIVATLGRTEELRRLFASLEAQSFRDFEVILVDQNSDDRLNGIVAEYCSEFPIHHVRSEPGLSRARNRAIGKISGAVVAFPDDDCWYPKNLLAQVHDMFGSNGERHGLTGVAVDEHHELTATNFSHVPGRITRTDVWRKAISFTIFLRRQVVDAVGEFDTTLGIGSFFGSGEETDYLLRALDAGFAIYFDPAIRVGHPNPISEFNEKTYSRARSYGRGMGRTMLIHHYGPVFVVARLIKPAVTGIILMCLGRFGSGKFHAMTAVGRFEGILHSFGHGASGSTPSRV
jgi:glycosyltransferase involved in cell wall biosynthesis